MSEQLTIDPRLVRRFYDAAWSYRHAVNPREYVAELDAAGEALGAALGRTFEPVTPGRASEPAHLHVVNPETGEVFEEEECPGCRDRDTIIRKQQRRISGLDLRIDNLERDREKEAQKSGRWPIGVRLFAIWQKMSEHPRSRFGADRLALLEPFLVKFEPRKHGEIGTDPGPPRHPYEACAAAIIGRCVDHYEVKRPNGTVKKYNEWERIFKNRAEWEESIARRPRNWRELAREHDPKKPEPAPKPKPATEPVQTALLRPVDH